LQKGPAAAEAKALASDLDFVNLGPELDDFSDTAAVISQLDLVLCVDTAVAHLAGALGKPVWLMLPEPADWRWFEGREDSPWYPTMRLFRQQRRGDWDEVVTRVKLAMQEQVRGGLTRTVSCANQVATSMLASIPPSLPRVTVEQGLSPGFGAAAETRVGILQYLPDEPLVGDSIGWYGEFLQPQLNLLARLVPPGATVMEVGAGVGVHTLFLAATVGAAWQLFL